MPEWREQLRARLAGLRLAPAREAEIVEELSQHLDQRYEELRNGGASEGDARRLAIAELREPEALARYMAPLRQANVPPPIAPGEPGRFLAFDLWQDLRYALRTIRKQPGFAAAAVFTLALGLGANSAIFALVDATLLRPLPFPQPERLHFIWERTQASARGRVSSLNLVDWTNRNRSFEAMGGFIPNVGGMVLGDAGGAPETVARQWVTAGIFDALGVSAIAGRTFLPSDDIQRNNVVVLSESFWRARFHADPGVVGRDLRLDGNRYTVAGVVPDRAQLIGRASVWALVSITGRPPESRSQYPLLAIGRLKPGVTQAAAAVDMTAVANGLASEFPATNSGRGVALEPLLEGVVGTELRQTSLLFLGVVGFVLVICCANVANLLLTRATARRRELAIRSALGAGRKRIIRQLLTESVALSTMGGAVGLAIGAAILRAAPSVIPQELLPAGIALTFDARVAAFCAVTAILVGVLFGLAPAWHATEFSSARAIGSNSRTATGRGGRMRDLLVGGQVATAVILLYGSGLLLRTLLAVENVDRGYRAESVLTMVVDPPGEQRVPWLPFYRAAAQEVMTLPGVRGVAWATTLPMGRSYQTPSLFEIVGEPPFAGSQAPAADYQIVSPSYFRTLDLPVVAGREFDERDVAGSVQVCVVNEAFVRAYVRGRSPIGLRLALRPAASSPAKPVVREIVGVARQVKARPNETEELLQIYVPLAQDTPGDIFLLVRPSAGGAAALGNGVRAAVARVDRDQLVSVRSLMTLDDVASSATARHRFRAVLVMGFAALALVLATVGLFGTLAYSVQQRLRDFGVRRALGATTGDVLWLVGGNAAKTIAAGGAVGLALSSVLGRSIATVLFGVQPMDPLTLASVSIVLALAAAVATVGPAWLATRIDPAIALRSE